MAMSARTSLTVITGPLKTRAARGFTRYASSFAIQPSRLSDCIVFCALWLLAAIEIYRRLKRELSGSYRPELHYMRGPGPKSREKHGQDSRAAPCRR